MISVYYRRFLTTEERFWLHVDRSGGSDSCWPWQAAIDIGGYGFFKLKRDGIKKMIKAHDYALELATGLRRPSGMVADHWCHNLDDSCNGSRTCLHRRCCNPSHLEWVSQSVNLKRSHVVAKRLASYNDIRKTATHCAAGHEFTPDNILRKKDGMRRCLTCHRIADREAKRRKRAAAIFGRPDVRLPKLPPPSDHI